jgi:predicted hydrocarbon binding protein
MYGLLNAALKEFVTMSHGGDAWDSVAQRAGVSGIQFNKMDPYPDALTYTLVGEIASATSQTVDAVLDQFGEHWVAYTAAQGYGPLFDIAGDSLRDFLLSLNELHLRVGRSFPKLVPPSFRFDTVNPHTLRMHYISQREGLCPMVPGLLRGLSNRFKTPIQVMEDTCARRGADHCEFVVILQPKSTWVSSVK